MARDKRKILSIILIVPAVLIALALLIELFYLPRYLIGGERVVPREGDDGETVVMSCNVRCISPFDLFRRSWLYRAELITEEISEVAPDIIGFQEVTFVHQNYLERVMQGYGFEVAYRDKFVLSEGCPIFYRADRYELVESGHFWLSETPEVMSKSWNSKHYRIAVYVVLEDKTDGTQFAVFNTHLDHQSLDARVNGIKVVLDKISELGDLPAILMGDLNADPDSETLSRAYESFDDSAVIAEAYDSGATYHDWGEKMYRERIDYILITSGDGAVSEYRVVDNLHGKAYASDHSPIYAKIKIRPGG